MIEISGSQGSSISCRTVPLFVILAQHLQDLKYAHQILVVVCRLTKRIFLDIMKNETIFIHFDKNADLVLTTLFCVGFAATVLKYGPVVLFCIGGRAFWIRTWASWRIVPLFGIVGHSISKISNMLIEEVVQLADLQNGFFSTSCKLKSFSSIWRKMHI